MTRLTANFTVTLDGPFLCRETVANIYRPISDSEATLDFSFGRFDVGFEFAGFSEHGHGTAAGPMAREVVALALHVTGSETAPPPVGADEAQLRGYVAMRQQEYSAVAYTVLARVARYFRFTLGNPLVHSDMYGLQPGVLNPVWADDTGRVIWNQMTTHAFTMRPALRTYPGCGVRAYESSHRPGLLAAIRDDVHVSFREELLAEARDAIALGNLRRAVLELAIACEVGVKHFYFQPDTRADSAYSYLEDKGRVNARVLDFLDQVAIRTFGKSLRVEQPDTYRNVDWLFRCRNKVAHRGLTTFRDDGGNEITARTELVCDWFVAVSNTFSWLDSVGA